MKRVIIYLLFCLIPSFTYMAKAQHRIVKNLPYIDQRIFHFGFTLGVHTQDLLIYHKAVEGTNEVWRSEIPHYSPGFTVGLITDLYINSFMNLRVTPSLLLGSKSMIFKEQNSGEEFVTTLRNNYISLPVDLKISTGRIENYSPFFTIGMYGNVELGSKREDIIPISRFSYGWQIGFGCDLYLPLFKLCPEIKFGFGLNNSLNKNAKPNKDKDLLKYRNCLNTLTDRYISLIFHFE